eukprot:1157896-Pelagomonas_calceolata.AAC.15
MQGAMLNHAFLGALAAVACKQELLLDLIASDDQAERGAYTMQVCQKQRCANSRGVLKVEQGAYTMQACREHGCAKCKAQGVHHANVPKAWVC